MSSELLKGVFWIATGAGLFSGILAGLVFGAGTGLVIGFSVWFVLGGVIGLSEMMDHLANSGKHDPH